jgi:hypothetical protein
LWGFGKGFTAVNVYGFSFRFLSGECRKAMTGSLSVNALIDAEPAYESSDADVWQASISSTTAAGVLYICPARNA